MWPDNFWAIPFALRVSKLKNLGFIFCFSCSFVDCLLITTIKRLAPLKIVNVHLKIRICQSLYNFFRAGHVGNTRRVESTIAHLVEIIYSLFKKFDTLKYYKNS